VGTLIHAATLVVLGLKKYFEEILAIDFRNSNTRVRNYYLDAHVFALVWHGELFYSDGDGGTFRTELNRILEQVDHDLLAAHFIDFD
jgi:hypothetical protein